MSSLLELSVPFFGPGTRALFHKGRGHGEEVSESSASWRFDMVKHQSDTDPDAVLLEISNLARRG
jgi:16S rRNA (guanine527-N7)-methyltransferase